MTRLSIFDFDRTLSKRPSYSAFLLFAAARTAPWRLALVPLLLPDGIAYAKRRIERKAMKERMHRLMLGRRLPRRKLERAAEAFARKIAASGLFPQALAQIAADRTEGRRILIATAAPRHYIAPLARLIGVDGVIATRESWDADHLLPGIDGENCYGPAKLAMIEHYLSAEGIDRAAAHVRFYSDDISDLPAFEWSDEAVAVNPSSGLRATALERGWPILDWRKAR